MRIRYQKIFDQKALDIVQVDVFELITKEQHASLLAADGAVRFCIKRKPVDRRVGNRITEFVYRISVLINSLNDAESSFVELRSKESCNRRITLILSRDGQRGKSVLLFANEPGIDKIYLEKLPALAEIE